MNSIHVFQFGEGNRMYVHGQQVLLKSDVLSSIEFAERYVEDATQGRALQNPVGVLRSLRKVISEL